MKTPPVKGSRLLFTLNFARIDRRYNGATSGTLADVVSLCRSESEYKKLMELREASPSRARDFGRLELVRESPRQRFTAIPVGCRELMEKFKSR